MIGPRLKTKVTTRLVLALVLLGLWQTGSGAWIYLKAQLAQVLLLQAWADTVAGQEHIKPWPWADTWPVARLTVPSEDVDLIVLNGAYGRTLAFGPGYLESSAPPGSLGTTILTGHRDTHFRFLQHLKAGEELLLTTKDRQPHRYRVMSTTVVDVASASIRQDTEAHQLALVTCYPFDAIGPGGPLRYVVMAKEEEHTEGVFPTPSIRQTETRPSYSSMPGPIPKRALK